MSYLCIKYVLYMFYLCIISFLLQKVYRSYFIARQEKCKSQIGKKEIRKVVKNDYRVLHLSTGYGIIWIKMPCCLVMNLSADGTFRSYEIVSGHYCLCFVNPIKWLDPTLKVDIKNRGCLKINWDSLCLSAFCFWMLTVF